MKLRKPRAKAKIDTINLYWVTTEDHDEDWFILAKTTRAAENYHIQYEGYEPGDAQAELILPAAEELFQGPIPRHAQLKDLQKLGFEILNADPNGAAASDEAAVPSSKVISNPWLPELVMTCTRRSGKVDLGEPHAAARTERASYKSELENALTRSIRQSIAFFRQI